MASLAGIERGTHRVTRASFGARAALIITLIGIALLGPCFAAAAQH